MLGGEFRGEANIAILRYFIWVSLEHEARIILGYAIVILIISTRFH